jgi:hypothetical protein
VLHKAKREEIWATEKKTNAIEEKKSTENRKTIFARAKQERYDRRENIEAALSWRCDRDWHHVVLRMVYGWRVAAA